MDDKKNNKKIIIIALIVAGVFIVFAGSYFGYTYYVNQKNDKKVVVVKKDSTDEQVAKQIKIIKNTGYADGVITAVSQNSITLKAIGQNNLVTLTMTPNTAITKGESLTTLKTSELKIGQNVGISYNKTNNTAEKIFVTGEE